MATYGKSACRKALNLDLRFFAEINSSVKFNLWIENGIKTFFDPTGKVKIN